jgi:hypothetical protein
MMTQIVHDAKSAAGCVLTFRNLKYQRRSQRAMVLFPSNAAGALHDIKGPGTPVGERCFRQADKGLKGRRDGQPTFMVCPFKAGRQLGNELFEIGFSLNCKGFSCLHIELR